MDKKISFSGDVTPSETLQANSIDLLKRGLRELGIGPGEVTVSSGEVTVEDLLMKFIFYIKELRRWNRAYNITSIKEEKDIIEKHFLDSLLYLPFLDRYLATKEGVKSVADVGSGGGFPGLVIKIVRPDLRMHLIEPSRKRSAFLRYMIHKLGLKDVEVHQKRIQDMGSHLKVDAVVSRALFKIRDIIKFAQPILKEGGIIVLNKGPEVYREIEEMGGLTVTSPPSKGVNLEVFERTLPHSNIKRNLIVVKL